MGIKESVPIIALQCFSKVFCSTKSLRLCSENRKEREEMSNGSYARVRWLVDIDNTLLSFTKPYFGFPARTESSVMLKGCSDG